MFKLIMLRETLKERQKKKIRELEGGVTVRIYFDKKQKHDSNGHFNRNEMRNEPKKHFVPVTLI